ncbi:MAG: ECF transporter S component [Tannerellaceae bacterium]|jgi:hypothetical protein|nr:ECF transporter S component [Tannerellaceae bacterium]
MQTTSLQFYSLNYSQEKTYLLAVAFVAGNIILPQLCHFVPQGGLMLLPIYFFTLIGAYKYGWKLGILTAVLSPVANYLLFGMPALPALPAILAKSVLLALSAGLAVIYFKRITIPILALVILAYQTVGTLLEWAMLGDFFKAIQDFSTGIPGMLIQIVGGYLVINYLIRK